jgi:hypothetical protein
MGRTEKRTPVKQPTVAVEAVAEELAGWVERS